MTTRFGLRTALIVLAVAALSACATDGQHHRGAYVGAEGGISR